MWSFIFFVESALMGVGLAMDAFSVSLANGLHEPEMPKRKSFLIAGTFGVFQALMPMLGWFLVKTVVQQLKTLEKIVPYIALVLLLFIGGKMVYEGIKNKNEDEQTGTTFAALLVQGIATSIDALSVGFTIESYIFIQALVESLIIAAVTFAICLTGIYLGKKFGMRFREKATIAGGVILIIIGIEIFIRGIFGI